MGGAWSEDRGGLESMRLVSRLMLRAEMRWAGESRLAVSAPAAVGPGRTLVERACRGIAG